MSHDTRTETADLDGLRSARDPEGRKTYLTVYADLTGKDWMQTLKDRAESFRFGISPEEAKGANVHHAFDTAFVAVERIAQGGAKGAVVCVSAVHDVEVAKPLDHPVETELILDDRPDLRQMD